MRVVIQADRGSRDLLQRFNAEARRLVLSRRPTLVHGGRCLGWFTRDWRKELDGCDVVIKLDRPQRQLPVPRRIDAKSSSREFCRRARLETAIAQRASAARVAAGEHRDDLCAPLRRPNDETRYLVGGTERTYTGGSARRRPRWERASTK